MTRHCLAGFTYFEVPFTAPNSSAAAGLGSEGQSGGVVAREAIPWHCQVNGAKPRFSPKQQESRNLSTDARHLSPIGKSPGSEESMMSGLKMMTTDSEQILDRTGN